MEAEHPEQQSLDSFLDDELNRLSQYWYLKQAVASSSGSFPSELYGKAVS